MRMHPSTHPVSDEHVHEAATRLRETLRLMPIAKASDSSDLDAILAWIAQQTEMPNEYRDEKPVSAP